MTAWHSALYKKHQARRSNKYSAKRLEVAGESYDSKFEHELHNLLKLKERIKKVSNIRRQVVIQLTRYVKWRADFVVFDEQTQRDIIVEAKGFEDLRWKVLKQLLPEFSPMPVQIWKKQNNRLFIAEEISPDARLK